MQTEIIGTITTPAWRGRTIHFTRSSRSAEASRMESARNRFSLAFSSSKACNRRALDNSGPPNAAFQLYGVAPEIPCLRAKTAAFAPRLVFPQYPDNLLSRGKLNREASLALCGSV